MSYLFSFKNLTKFLFLFIGCALTANGAIMLITTNFNIGNILTVALGLILLLYGIYFDKVNTKTPKWIKAVFVLGLCVIIAFSVFIMAYGSNDNVTYKEDAVIVLGAAIHGKTPSLVLKDRLDTAVEYHKQNPDAYIIVSGGQGHQEDITEAEAMEKYLIEKGVNKVKIIKEEKATSTYENFLFSNKILKERLGEDINISFITTDFHIYRASNIAKSAGINDITHIHSNTRWYSIATSILRECLAVTKFWILGN